MRKARRGRLTRAAALAGLFAAASPAFAQDGPLLIDRGRLDRAREPAPPRASRQETPDGAIAVAPADRAAEVRPLREARILGATLAPAALDGAWRARIGRPLTQTLAAEIAEALAVLYRDSDVALYSIQVPRQDLADGDLDIRVIEGALSDVAIETDDPDADDIALVRAYTEHLLTQAPLRRPALERAFALIRDLPGVTLSADFRQGGVEGAARLVLRIEHDRIRFGAAVNNRGTPRLGRTQLSVDAAWNGIVFAGDTASLVLAAPTEFERFQFAALSYGTAIGEDGLRLRFSASRLDTRPEDMDLRGRAETAGVALSYPLVALNAETLSVSAALDAVDSENATLGRVIDTSRTRVLRAAFAYGRAFPRWSFGAGAAFSAGIDSWGAEADALFTDLDFTKLTAHASLDRALTETLRLRLRAAGQESEDRLPGSELFALGGDAFGRAFPGALVAGDSGLAGSAEIAHAPRAFLPEWAQGSEAYLFLDGGQIRREPRAFLPGFVTGLASAGGGVRLALLASASVGIEAAYGLDAPLGAEADDWRVLFAARSRFED